MQKTICEERKKERKTQRQRVKALQSRSSSAVLKARALFEEQTLSAAPTVLSMWPSKIKLDEEKSKHAVLAQRNVLSPRIFPQMMILIKKCTVERNKYDLTAMRRVIDYQSLFRIAQSTSMFGLSGLLLAVSHLFGIPV